MLITAKIQKPIERISQCDIFKDVDVVEYVKETEGKVIVSTVCYGKNELCNESQIRFAKSGI